MERLTSGRYRRYLKVKGGDVCLDAEALRQAPRLDGTWVLITHDDTLSVEDAASALRRAQDAASKRLLVIERCFRSLKRGQIHLGPMYHQLPQRIEAHVKICVLALLLQRVVEHTTGESWFPLRHQLNGLQAIEFRTATHPFFHRTEPTHELRRLFKTLEISIPNQVLAVHPLPSELSAHAVLACSRGSVLKMLLCCNKQLI
jgi:hypothetical protein